MPTVAMYRCSKCGTEYRPLDAGARQFRCCGQPLERVPLRRAGGLARTLASLFDRRENEPPAPPPREDDRQPGAVSQRRSATKRLVLLEVIPPRENTVDALSAETLLSSLAMPGARFALEIAGDAGGRRFLVRAPAEMIPHIKRQMQAIYDQVEFVEIPPEKDPAARRRLPTAMAELTLRRPVYLPLRTYHDGDFREADPIRALLGAFGDFEDGESALAQIVLAPAPPHWADRWQGSTRRIDQSFVSEGMTMGMLARQIVAPIVVIGFIGAFLCMPIALVTQQWNLLLLAIPAFLFLALVSGLFFWWMQNQANIDPTMVQRKTAMPAYDAALRLVAVGKTVERARARLREQIGAYSQYNLASGNALVARWSAFDPQALDLPQPSWWQEWMGQVMRLNVAELASLWHLPVGTGVQLVTRTMDKRLLPLPENVSEGVLIGHSVHQGQSVPVHLPPEAMRQHMFMVAKTQKGKSTLMAHLAEAAMRENRALVVIDPHGDLTRSLLSKVPRQRIGDVINLDFSLVQQVVGLNLLDMSQGRSAEAIVSNIVHVGEHLWSDYWGPRMEDALRAALRLLIMANQILLRQGKPQFRLLDVPPLFELHNFGRRMLRQFAGDSDLLRWWGAYYESMNRDRQMEIVNPVLTKLHRFSTHSVVRNITGQSNSTVNFRELLNERRILLVNTATGVIGPDAGGLLGAMIVDYINFAVREQMAIPDPAARARVTVIVDEFQSIPGVDYPALLAELQKMGANFVLATQSLGQLDVIDRALRPAILSNVATLFVWNTSAEDADFLRHELDEAVTATDIINLADHTCYVKTQSGRRRLPVMYVETLPPSPGDPWVEEQVLAQMRRYARPVAVVEQEQREFEEYWYGAEMRALRKYLTMQTYLREREPTEQKYRKAEDEVERVLFQSGVPDVGHLGDKETGSTPPAKTMSTRAADTSARGTSEQKVPRQADTVDARPDTGEGDWTT